MISGTTHQSNLVKFKEDRKLDGCKEQLAYTWFNGFVKRNPTVITRRAVKFAISRSQWCNLQKFEIMYNAVYEESVLTGVACKIESDGAYMDSTCSIVDDEGDACGRKGQYKLTHPEYLLFVDEVGSNTNMSRDENKGGERLVCERGSVSRQQASTSDAHFTVLRFINVLSQPVLCGIIIGGASFSPDQILGFDIMAALPEEVLQSLN